MSCITTTLADGFCHRVAQAVASFSSKNRRALELYASEQFLEGLGLRFAPADLVQISEENHPIDVTFRDAAFQVKELLDVGRRRHDDLRAEERRLAALRKRVEAGERIGCEQLGRLVEPTDVTLSEITDRAHDQARRLRDKKYGPSERSSMDLLFYVNLLHQTLALGSLPSTSFAELGYRSVSVVFTYSSIVFHADRNAPSFLREAQGIVKFQISQSLINLRRG